MRTQHTPGCTGTEKDSFRITDLNHRIATREFRYLHCHQCGLYRLEDVPENLGDYYPDEYYELPTLGQLAKVAAADPFKITTVQRFISRGRLLEIGPAYGTFAYQAKEAGFEVDVIEMDARCCDYLNRVVGVNAVCSSAPHVAMQGMRKHDVIALWHVIEHLPDPWVLLREAATNLAPGGILVIAAPNPDAWQFRVMGKAWPHLDAPRHLYLIPQSALTNYAGILGLTRLHCSTTDSDAKSWNRFGWQRLLMNAVRSKSLQWVAYILGYMFSIVVSPIESHELNGSAYTLVFRKPDK